MSESNEPVRECASSDKISRDASMLAMGIALDCFSAARGTFDQEKCTMMIQELLNSRSPVPPPPAQECGRSGLRPFEFRSRAGYQWEIDDNKGFSIARSDSRENAKMICDALNAEPVRVEGGPLMTDEEGFTTGSCPDCGNPVTAVRPGKWQCDYCSGSPTPLKSTSALEATKTLDDLVTEIQDMFPNVQMGSVTLQHLKEILKRAYNRGVMEDKDCQEAATRPAVDVKELAHEICQATRALNRIEMVESILTRHLHSSPTGAGVEKEELEKLAQQCVNDISSAEGFDLHVAANEIILSALQKAVGQQRGEVKGKKVDSEDPR